MSTCLWFNFWAARASADWRMLVCACRRSTTTRPAASCDLIRWTYNNTHCLHFRASKSTGRAQTLAEASSSGSCTSWNRMTSKICWELHCPNSKEVSMVNFSQRSDQLFKIYEPNCGKCIISQCWRILLKQFVDLDTDAERTSII